MAISSEDIQNLYERAEMLLEEIARIRKWADGLEIASEAITGSAAQLGKLTSEVESLVTQIQKVVFELGRINTDLISGILTTIDRRTAGIEGVAIETRDSISVLQNKNEAQHKELQTTLVQKIDKGITDTTEAVGVLRTAILKALTELEKATAAKIRQLYEQQEKNSLAVFKKLKMIKYSIWTGFLIVLITQAVSIFLYYNH